MGAKHLIIAVVLLGSAWTQLEQEEKFDAVFKDKCLRNGGPDALRNAEKAALNVTKCWKSLVGQAVQEMQEAKTEERIGYVLKKHCANKHEFKHCFGGELDAVRPCFTEDEQENLVINNNMTPQLVEFLCLDDGRRVALFIVKDGLRCLVNQMYGIQDCVNRVMGDQFLSSSMRILNFGEKECNQYLTLRSCFVRQLQSCPQPTTTNLVKDLCKYTLEVTPCRNYTGSASGLAVTSLTLIMTAATLLV